MLGLIPLGLLHMRPLQIWLKARVPSRAWKSERLMLKVTHDCHAALEIPSPFPLRHGARLGMQTECADNIYFKDGEPASGTWKLPLEMLAAILAFKH